MPNAAVTQWRMWGKDQEGGGWRRAEGRVGRASGMRRSELADCCVSRLTEGNATRISHLIEAWRQQMETSRKPPSAGFRQSGGFWTVLGVLAPLAWSWVLNSLETR